MSPRDEPINEPRLPPPASIEPQQERAVQNEAIKERRPVWKRSAVIVSLVTPLVSAIMIAVLASVGEIPRLDASSQAKLEASLQRMTAEMSDAQKKEFLAECMELTVPDMMKSAFQLAFLRNRPPASNWPRMFKPLQGMNASEIHWKAKEARRASRNAEKNAAASPPDQPLPGVPSPFGASPDMEKLVPE
jgi:hypothetical protein